MQRSLAGAMVNARQFFKPLLMQTQERFDLWCIVELFGHQKIAGRCTEQNIAGTNMLRVDVPATDSQPSFTRFFGSAAIYAINPVDESTAKYYAEQLRIKPIEAWNIDEIIKKKNSHALGMAATVNDDYFFYDHDDDNDHD